MSYRKYDLQEIANLEHDDTLDLKKVMPYGWDGSQAVALPVDSAGNLIIDPTNLDDRYLGLNIDYFLDDTASDISGYKTLSNSPGVASTIGPTTITADDQLIEEFATPTTEPTFTVLHAGTYMVHIHASVDSITGRDRVRLYWKLYYCDADGTNETLLTTSEESDLVTDAEAEYEMHSTLSTETTIGATQRLVVKIYVSTTEAGTDPALTLNLEGTTASRLMIESNITALDTRYAPIAKGVTNGDSHDHSGGDGAQIDHGGLAGLTDDDHTQYISTAPASDTRNVIQPTNAAYVPLTLKGAASQSDDFFKVTDSLDANVWRITSTKQLIYGNPLALGAQQIGVFQDANYAQLFYQCSSDDTAHNNSFYFRRSRGTNQAATTVGNGDGVFSILGLARGSSAFVPSFQMVAKVEGTPSSNTVPVWLNFLVGQTAATAITRLAMHATNALGGMVINEDGADYDFRIEGDTITNLFHLLASADSIGLGITPTARFHLMAGLAAAGKAPLKFTAGTNLTDAEAGAVEWDGTNLFVTQTTGPTRKTVAYTSDIAANVPVFDAAGTQYLIALVSNQFPVYDAAGTQYLIALV